MSPDKSNHGADDLRGLSKLAIDATMGITDLVEALHHNITGKSGLLPACQDGRTDGITGLVYKAVRGTTRITGMGIDAALSMLTPQLAGLTDRLEREHIQSAINGILGDHLVASGNPLAITMTVRVNGNVLALNRAALTDALPAANGKILLLVHGLCMNDRQWTRTRADGYVHDHGKALQIESGFTAVYLHYNTGLHIAQNGQTLADLLQTLVAEWPVAIEEIVILAHSMGGLVARSACHHAELANHTWLGFTQKIIFLGTPHYGAPLERGGYWFDLILGATPFAAPFAKIGKMRSNGITDLRHGSITGKHNEHLPLPETVDCFAIAGSVSARKDEPADKRLGDGLVPIASALGEHEDPQHSLAFSDSHKIIASATNHMQLLSDENVYTSLKKIIAS